MNLTPKEIYEIREAYKATLGLSAKQFFLCPVGLVGAGKTTVVGPLSEIFSLVRISSDEVRRMLKERGFGYDALMDIVRPLVEEVARAGYSIAIDADCGNPRTKELVENVAAEVSAKTFWVHVAPPESFILDKLRRYKHTWLFRDSSEAVDNYFEQKKRREEEHTNFDFLATIDTSRADLPRQIDLTAELIRDRLT